MSLLRTARKIPMTLRTFSASSNVGGEWTAGTATDTTIFATPPQPVTGRELLSVPEGDRQRAHYWVFTDAGVTVHDSSERQNADHLIFSDGRVFLVVKAEYWEDGHREIFVRHLPGEVA